MFTRVCTQTVLSVCVCVIIANKEATYLHTQYQSSAQNILIFT